MKITKILLITFFAVSLYASEIAPGSYLFGQYLFTDLGSGAGNYRDEGTSPLLYEGLSLNLGMGYLSDKPHHTWEIRSNSNYMLGMISSGYAMHHFTEDVQISYLHTIPAFIHPDMILKAGGRMSGTVSGSMNSALENASFNLDIFAALNARAQVTYAFIKPEKKKKHRTIPETRHALICQIELPVMLLNARPEFPFVIDGNAISLDRHVFLGGFFMQSNIGLRSFLPNGNAFEVSYVWKMYLTGKHDIYDLEMARHIFQLSYYFKLD